MKYLALGLSVLGTLGLMWRVGVLEGLMVLMVALGFFIYDQLGYTKMQKDVRIIKSKDPRARRS